MQDNRIQAYTIQKAQRESKIIDVIQDRAPDFDYSKFGRLRGMRGGGKDAEVPFDFAFGAEGVEEPGYSVSIRLSDRLRLDVSFSTAYDLDCSLGLAASKNNGCSSTSLCSDG